MANFTAKRKSTGATSTVSSLTVSSGADYVLTYGDYSDYSNYSDYTNDYCGCGGEG